MTCAHWWPVAAVVMVAACGDDPGTITVSGTIEIRQVQLAPLTSGRLVRLLKDEGDTVRAGDTVAVLVQPGLGALIEQRRAQATAAASRTAEVVAAEADSARAASDLDRARRLLPGGGISQQQFDAARSAAAAATARLQAARAAASEVEAAGAAVDVARSVRDQLVLLAPADGVVLTRYAEPGEAIVTGMPVVVIGLVRSPWVRAYVGERFIGRLKVGQEARVRVDGYPDTAFLGRVTQISSRAEFTPRAALTERERADLVFGIKVQVPDGGGRLKAGMPVEVDLPLLP
jgi:HlyD family secretion protein